MDAVVIAAVAFLAGSVPASNVAARRSAGVDLRTVGSGTVSGTSLYRVAGFGPLAVAGVFDVAKGALGPLLAGGDRPWLQALCCGLAVVGHNWSPFLRGAGGRGISPSLGGLLVTAWPGAVALALGLVLGRFARRSGLGTFAGLVVLVPATATHGAAGAAAGAAITVPMLAKRVAGNHRPRRRGAGVYVHRLLYDNDGDPIDAT